MKSSKIQVIGGGLAGSEAALTLSRLGYEVRLSEMRPVIPTPAHRSEYLAELVCSNSFGSDSPLKAKGLLKAEIEMAGAVLPGQFGKFTVPAGQAFAVDALLAAEEITNVVENDPNIELVREEVQDWPGGPAIIASGPLTSGKLIQSISRELGTEFLHFFDAISPSIYFDTVDMSKAYFASRYDKGGDDYLNIPLDETEYNTLVESIISAERVEIREYEPDKLFESCLPVEVLAGRGLMSLAFGPLKPRGLPDPSTGKEPFAVIQLRRETLSGETYNLVGFQTRMKHSEQKRILRELPALKNVKFARLGAMHLNAYLEGPAMLNPDLSLKAFSEIFIAGQLAGGEGYLEAIATGFYAAFNLARRLEKLPPAIPPVTTMSGALTGALTTGSTKYFGPKQVQFGLLPALEGKIKGKKNRDRIRARKALDDMKLWLGGLGIKPAGYRDIDDE